MWAVIVRPPWLRSERRGQLGALLDGALGIELRGHVGATDQGHLLACGFQTGLQVTERLLPGAQHHVVHRQHEVLATHRDVQARVVDALPKGMNMSSLLKVSPATRIEAKSGQGLGSMMW